MQDLEKLDRSHNARPQPPPTPPCPYKVDILKIGWKQNEGNFNLERKDVRKRELPIEMRYSNAKQNIL